MATIVKKRKTSLWGLIQEIFGFLVVIWGIANFVISSGIASVAILVIGIVIMVVGFLKSFKTVCSECRNRVEDKEVKMCPVCKVTFD
tara:strand:- start:326 stop:586 length:261 start_codon:yes stop_codon:yes gene_type:complete